MDPLILVALIVEKAFLPPLEVRRSWYFGGLEMPWNFWVPKWKKKQQVENHWKSIWTKPHAGFPQSTAHRWSSQVAYPAIFFACLLWFTVSDPRKNRHEAWENMGCGGYLRFFGGGVPVDFLFWVTCKVDMLRHGWWVWGPSFLGALTEFREKLNWLSGKNGALLKRTRSSRI